MIVLDTCAFLTQKHPNGEFATVPGIKNEIVNKQSKQYFENMLATNLKIIDLTGAGDLFAAGYLHGIINNLSIKECLIKGTELSSKIIQKIGARI